MVLDPSSAGNGGKGQSSGAVSAIYPQPAANFGSELIVNLGAYDPQTGTVELSETSAGPVGLPGSGGRARAQRTYVVMEALANRLIRIGGNKSAAAFVTSTDKR